MVYRGCTSKLNVKTGKDYLSGDSGKLLQITVLWKSFLRNKSSQFSVKLLY
jgi:hypothetical protein